jgi:hypothetical protein
MYKTFILLPNKNCVGQKKLRKQLIKLVQSSLYKYFQLKKTENDKTILISSISHQSKRPSFKKEKKKEGIPKP